MRISDWSSDVCSSDLGAGGRNRTDTLSPELDFESSASTSSATPAISPPIPSAALGPYTAPSAIFQSRVIEIPARQPFDIATLSACHDLGALVAEPHHQDRKSTRLNSSH